MLLKSGNDAFIEKDFCGAVASYVRAIFRGYPSSLYLVNTWLALNRLGLKLGEKDFFSIEQQPELRAEKVLSRTEKKQIDKQVGDLLKKLYDLEFSEHALVELLHILLSPKAQKYARELVLWHLGLWFSSSDNLALRRLSLVFFDLLKDMMRGEKSYLSKFMASQVSASLGEYERGVAFLEGAKKGAGVQAEWALARANLEISLEEKGRYINDYLSFYGIEPIRFEKNSACGGGFFDRVGCKNLKAQVRGPLVSIIIPVYNSEKYIACAIRSLLCQTYVDIEILVSDDASTDNTVEVAQAIADVDERVKVIKSVVNRGPYAARNAALSKAKGEFVTTHDADDWSHPSKIKVQAEDLIKNRERIANASQQIRITEGGTIYLRPKSRCFTLVNLSSLMFRKNPVLEKLGGWDEVRFAADSEFLKRLKLEFGEAAYKELETGALCFQRQTSGSLTSDVRFGYSGYKTGVRREYDAAAQYYYAKDGASLYYKGRGMFPCPQSMLSDKKLHAKHYDVIIASDFRLPGGTTHSNIEEVKAQVSFGFTTGLLHLPRYDLNPSREINDKVRALIDGEKVQLISAGEEATCDHLVIRHPPVVQRMQDRVATIACKRVSVIVNQPPKREYSKEGEVLYELAVCQKNIEKCFAGAECSWYPIGPLVRASLDENHNDELQHVVMSSEDWVNIINVAEWRRDWHDISDVLSKKRPIKVGRHSRDQYVKWPEDSKVLRQVYPESDEIEVHVLGGATSAQNVLGYIPQNWKVVAFDGVHPREFLKDIDVYVYYTHSDWVEAFGRVIFEAMAAGVPVVLPHHYEPLFGAAAIYSEVGDVIENVKAIMSDQERYDLLVENAVAYVEDVFGYGRHKKRLVSRSL